MIKIKNLSKKYKDFNALKDINLTLPSKGLIGITGQSGSGKSTLLNALSLMDDNYEGEILVNNKNILKYNEKQKDKYHLNIGYIFQNTYLFENISVYENIKYLSLIKGRKYKINELLKKVDLLKYKNKKVNTLSGGQRQRVSIAASLISKPFMLLCDEPTGALDSFNSKKVMEILKEISKEILVIVVSHDLNLIKEYSDKIININNGTIDKEIEINKEKEVVKFKKKDPFNHLLFIFKFCLSNLINKKKRSILTSIMISFGLIGVLFSLLIKEGFTSYFVHSFSEYESNKYVYCYKINEDENIDLKEFKVDFKDYQNGYLYRYDFKENKEGNINKIHIGEYDTYLNFNNLFCVKEIDNSYLNSEIGLCLNKDYLDYFLLIFNKQNIDELNRYLKSKITYLEFKYSDEEIDLNFKLRLKNIIESKNSSYFIHNDSSFLEKYFKGYISTDLNYSKIKIIPYIKNKEEDKIDLYLNDNLKKYDYVFDNKIYDEKYTFVYSSLYYRISKSDIDKMNELINSSYYLSINNGIDMMGYFNDNLSFLNEDKLIKGSKVSFIPLEDDYKSILEVSISRGLFNLLQDKIYIKGFDKEYLLSIKNIIENDDLVIYQKSEWSYQVFLDLFNFKDYEMYGVSVAFSNNDNKSINLLTRNFSEFEVVCPLKELTKEIDSLVDKIKLVLLILSSFCIIMSILLMIIIVFINTLEQEKIISILRVNGVSKEEVIFIFLLEAILIGFIALIISYYMALVFSMELNVVFNMLINETGIEFISLKKDTLINVFLIVMLLSILSSIIPSFIASKKNSLKVLKS